MINISNEILYEKVHYIMKNRTKKQIRIRLGFVDHGGPVTLLNIPLTVIWLYDCFEAQ